MKIHVIHSWWSTDNHQPVFDDWIPTLIWQTWIGYKQIYTHWHMRHWLTFQYICSIWAWQHVFSNWTATIDLKIAFFSVNSPFFEASSAGIWTQRSLDWCGQIIKRGTFSLSLTVWPLCWRQIRKYLSKMISFHKFVQSSWNSLWGFKMMQFSHWKH